MMHRILMVMAVILLCHCGAPRVPQCRIVPLSSRGNAKQMVEEARAYWRILEDRDRKSEWGHAQAGYNRVVAKLVDQLRCGGNRWDKNAEVMGTSIAGGGADRVNPKSLDAVFPAREVKWMWRVKERKVTDGLGVAMVGWERTAPVGQERAKYAPPTGRPYILTAVLEFPPQKQPEWKFLIRWSQEKIHVGTQDHVLAADWSAPNVFYWNMCELDDLSLQNVILPERFSQDTGVIFVTPYDPKKIPLVLVHGLVSSPAAYKNVINELAPQPWFRQNYQIWLYNYPTGNPWIYSARKFREKLREACDDARKIGGKGKLDQMVVVGHSMGGVIAHASLVDPGEKMYQANYRLPLPQLPVSEVMRKKIGAMYLYKPLTEPKRVVFMAAPHQGSPAANYRLAGRISKVIKLPKTLTVELLDATVMQVDEWFGGGDGPVAPLTSIDSLSPKYVNNRVLAQLPLPKQVKFHSIIGDRGKGDGVKGSDGVVPYWSSHLEPVESEVIVPSHHSVPNNREAALELERILQKHLKQQARN